MFAATKLSTVEEAKAWLQQTNKNAKQLHPYTWWNHPFLGWIDTLINMLGHFIYPLCSSVKYLPTGDEKEKAVAYNQTVREKGIKLNNVLFSSSALSPFRTWQTLAGCVIAEVDYSVPRVVNLLNEWGITSTVPSENCSPKGDIKVKLFFPASFLGWKEIERNTAEVSSFGTLPVELNDLSCLLAKVPFVLVFHGGGMVVGDAYGMEIPELVNVVKETTRPLIIASVEYSLSPEFSFPVAIEECLAVADHFLSSRSGLKHEKIHIGGDSAGGYLATIVTMELIRRHPGKVESCCAFAPMMNPATDSLSSFMNGSTSFVQTDWIRWTWQAYLQLPPSKDTMDDDDDTSLDALLAHGSNRTTWAESKYKADKTVERLIYPLADLPKEQLEGPNAPRFLVTTNRGDPLYNDGLALVTELKKALSTNAKNLIYLDDTGSHVIGTTLLNQKPFTIAWAITIFGPDAWV